jgi:hypothetical protein
LWLFEIRILESIRANAPPQPVAPVFAGTTLVW